MTSSHPKATLVLLVRHGVTAQTGSILYGRLPGHHLSDTGREQAATAAERIASLGDRVAAVDCSPLERTRETAAPIGDRLGRTVELDERLIEADFGEWTGRPLDDLRKEPLWPDIQRAPSTVRFPGGESFEEMQRRMIDAVEESARRHRGEAIVLVSHADPIKVLLAHAAGTHLDLFQRLAVSPASVSALAVGDGTPVVLAVNTTAGDLRSLTPQ